jgi:hypothetical protein
MVDILEGEENQYRTMLLIIHKLENQFNDVLLYAIYRLLKMKGSWFESCHNELLRVLDLTMDKELIAKSRGMLGKVLGLLLKKNEKVVDMVLKRVPTFEMDEVSYQVFI